MRYSITPGKVDARFERRFDDFCNVQEINCLADMDSFKVAGKKKTKHLRFQFSVRDSSATLLERGSVKFATQTWKQVSCCQISWTTSPKLPWVSCAVSSLPGASVLPQVQGAAGLNAVLVRDFTWLGNLLADQKALVVVFALLF